MPVVERVIRPCRKKIRQIGRSPHWRSRRPSGRVSLAGIAAWRDTVAELVARATDRRRSAAGCLAFVAGKLWRAWRGSFLRSQNGLIRKLPREFGGCVSSEGADIARASVFRGKLYSIAPMGSKTPRTISGTLSNTQASWKIPQIRSDHWSRTTRAILFW